MLHSARVLGSIMIHVRVDAIDRLTLALVRVRLVDVQFKETHL